MRNQNFTNLLTDWKHENRIPRTKSYLIMTTIDTIEPILMHGPSGRGNGFLLLLLECETSLRTNMFISDIDLLIRLNLPCIAPSSRSTEPTRILRRLLQPGKEVNTTMSGFFKNISPRFFVSVKITFRRFSHQWSFPGQDLVQ